MHDFMKDFSLRSEIIIPILLGILTVIVKIFWNKFIETSVKRAAKKRPEFQEFIRKVIAKEQNGKNQFSRDALECSRNNVIKYARFKEKMEKSEMIWFDEIDNWNAHSDIKIRQFFYYLTITKNKRNKYMSA